MKKFLQVTLLFVTALAFSQVGIGTTTPNGALDIASTTNGFLPPRVPLTALNVASPIVNPAGGAVAQGTIVWNTATANTGVAAPPNSISPGLYYWDSAKWVAFAGATGGLDWSLMGNANTTVATNFLGTTDNVNLAVKTNNIERMRVLSGGTVVGSTTIIVGDRFSSYGLVNEYASNGYGDGASGVGLYGGATGATGMGVIGVNSSATGTGIIAGGNNQTPSFMTNGSGATFTGSGMGSVGLAKTAASGWGVLGAGNNLAVSTLAQGGGGAFVGNQWGVFANASLSGSPATDRAAFIGNFNESSTARTVYLGARIGGVNYKVLGTGSASVSTTMPTRDGERILFAPEAPENWFFDIGEVQLVNGKATVELDPLFVDCIADSKPFKVFVQGGENTLGSIRITRNQNDKSFVLEDLGGASSGVVQYSIYAIWKQKENLRFPKYESPIEIKQQETKQLKIKK